MTSAAERKALIQALRAQRGGNFLLTYITSTRPGMETQMAMDSIRKIYGHLQKITTPKEETKIDLFIHSNGGDGVVPWKLVTLIREYCTEFNVLVAHRAFSAATLTAIGANNIYMHPMGMLGPTDPKVANDFNPLDAKGAKMGISVEDVISYISLVKEDVGIHHEDELIKAFELLAGSDRVHPLALGNVKRFYSQSRMMAKKLLQLHMDRTSEEHKIKDIADNLNSKLYFHGHPINRIEAREQLGLPVRETTPALEKAMWDLYESYEKEMKLEEPFNPALALHAANPTGLPNAQGVPATLDIKDCPVAFVESENGSDVFQVSFRIQGAKNGFQDMVGFTQTSAGWK